MKYKLIVQNGYYESNSMFLLLKEVLSHRLHHMFSGQGFQD